MSSIDDSSSLSKPESAARFIFLNQLAYGGLYKENNGLFKVPLGNTTISAKLQQNIKSASSYLLKNNVTIECGDYETILRKNVNKGDFVYLDPPYCPVKPSSYTKYNGKPFDQKRLAKVFKWLNTKGCLVLLSNSNCPEVKKLYEGFKIIEIEVVRGFGVGKVKELLIKNY